MASFLQNKIARKIAIVNEKHAKQATTPSRQVNTTYGGVDLSNPPQQAAQPLPPKTATPTPTFQQYDNEMPSSAYQQYLSNKQSESIVRENEFKAKLSSESSNIDPSARYILKSSNPLANFGNFNKETILPGSAIKNIYAKQIKDEGINEQEYRIQLQATSNRVSKLGPDILVSSTVRGTEFKYDTMADSRKQLATANAMNKIIPGGGEAYKLGYSIWGSAVETGRGIRILESVMVDFFAPGKGKDVKAAIPLFKEGTVFGAKQYTAVPSIWTGEGRNILSKLGWSGYVGAGAFEVGSFYVGGKLLEPFAVAGSTLIKTGSKKLLTSSLLKGTTVTEEVALAGGGRIVATETAGKLSRFIPSAIKESTTLQNFEKWAVQGYRPGKTLVEVSKGTPIKLGELNIQKLALETDKSVGFWNRRIWLSPTEQVDYASRIARQGIMNIGFPTSEDVGKYFGNISKSGTREGFAKTGTKLTMAGERETFQTGFWGGLKGRISTTFLKEDILGTELGTAKGGSRAYKITDLVQPWKDVGIPNAADFDNIFLRGSSPYSPFRSWIEEGFTRETPVIYRPGAIRLEAFEGFGKQTAPLSEKAVWGLREPGILSREAFSNFAKDVRASMTETIQIVKPSSILSKGGRLSGVSMNVPSDILGKGISSGLTLGILGTTRIGLNVLSGRGEIKNIHQQPDIKLKQVQNNVSITEKAVISESVKPQVLVVEQEYFVKQDQVQRQEQVQLKILAQEQEQIQTTKFVSLKIPINKNFKEKIVVPPPVILPTGLYGRGMRGMRYKFSQKRYKFRKANYAKNPFDIKMPKVKI